MKTKRKLSAWWKEARDVSGRHAPGASDHARDALARLLAVRDDHLDILLLQVSYPYPHSTMPRAKEPATGASIAQAQQDAGSEGIDNFELPRSLIMKLARASQVSTPLDMRSCHPHVLRMPYMLAVCAGTR